MVEFFVQLPRPLATVVKAARRRYGGERFARAFAAGLDLARRAQGWDTPSRQYKVDDRVTVRFALPDDCYAEIQRLKSFFGRARWEIVAAGVRFALRDNAGNIIAYVARGDGVDAGPSGPRDREDGRGEAVAVRRKPGGPGSTPGAGLLALAPRRRLEGASLRASDGSRTVEATVLFADVRGFTAIAEAQGPEGTVAMLNDYFARMTACIAAEGGMLDKFIGDAIMAGFGVPVAHDDDPDRAVRASIAMIRALDAWNVERAKDGRRAVEIGVGLNTDMVVTGDIGSPQRKDFTMIGDGVNLAARLESACKQYGARILISENTRIKLKGSYRIREADLVVVKGKTEPVGVHEVLDHYTEATFPNMAECGARFAEGVARYRAGDWDRATACFKAALAATPDDKLAQVYVKRCRKLKADPPRNWTGVWTMTSK